MSKSCPTCGKRLDPTWLQCPYCAREKQANQRNISDVSAKEADPMSNKKPRDLTKVGRDADDQPPGRETRFYDPPRPGPAAHARPPDNRRIVGVLVSYTWVPGGEI